jgi:hypothetical protein
MGSSANLWGPEGVLLYMVDLLRIGTRHKTSKVKPEKSGSARIFWCVMDRDLPDDPTGGRATGQRHLTGQQDEDRKKVHHSRTGRL